MTTADFEQEIAPKFVPQWTALKHEESPVMVSTRLEYWAVWV
jgi:hypothetical protein